MIEFLRSVIMSWFDWHDRRVWDRECTRLRREWDAAELERLRQEATMRDIGLIEGSPGTGFELLAIPDEVWRRYNHTM